MANTWECHGSLFQALLQSGECLVEVAPCSAHIGEGLCLPFPFAKTCAEAIDFADPVVHQGGVTVAELNAALRASIVGGARPSLEFAPADVTSYEALLREHNKLVFHVGRRDTIGHFFGVVCDNENETVTIHGMGAAEFTLGANVQLVCLQLDKMARLAAFKHTSLIAGEVAPAGVAYELRGAGDVEVKVVMKRPAACPMNLRGAGDATAAAPVPKRVLTTPLTKCAMRGCGSRLVQCDTFVDATLVGMCGVEHVTHDVRRCQNKACRTYHHYNYMVCGKHQEINTVKLDEVECLFVTSSMAMTKQYLGTMMSFSSAAFSAAGLSHGLDTRHCSMVMISPGSELSMTTLAS